MKTVFGQLLILISIAACQVKPTEINYGSDACHFCKMTIVDAQHASQIVTTKGKSFKYDAIECMLNHYANWDQAEIAMFLVADYETPKKLIDATKAYYLISPVIPSPMGEFLSGFENVLSRDQYLENSQGKPYNWNELTEKFLMD